MPITPHDQFTLSIPTIILFSPTHVHTATGSPVLSAHDINDTPTHFLFRPTTMNVAFKPLAPTLMLSADLQARVKQRAEGNLCKIIAKLSGAVFYSDSPALQPLRSILGEAGPGKPLIIAEEDEPQAIQQFCASVPFTTYVDYLPYVSKVAETSQARLSDVRDLLAPGLPIFVAHSSGTSGAGLKYFLKYPNPRYIGAHWDEPGPHQIMMSGISAIRLNSVTVIVDDDGGLVDEIPITTISSGGLRAYMGIGPRDDDKIVSEKGGPFFFSLSGGGVS